MKLVNWITGNMGTSGVDLIYQSMHMISVGAVLMVLTVLLLIAGSRKIMDSTKEKVLRGTAWFHIGFELLWRILYLIFCDVGMTDLWPNYACNLNGVLVPVICLLNRKTGKKMFYTFALLGGCATFINPEGIFTNSVFVFPILKSILQHTGLLFIPLYEMTTGTYRPSIRDYLWTVLGILIHIVNCELFSRIWGGTEDYLYLRSGLPFTIEGVPNWSITLASAFLVVLIVMFLINPKVSVHSLKRHQKQAF